MATIDIGREWRLFRDDEPGVRFANAWRRMRDRPRWLRAIPILVGLVLIAGGLVMLFVPGPGVATAALGLGFVSSSFRPLANALDRLEPAARRRGRWVLALWRDHHVAIGRMWFGVTAIAVGAALVLVSAMTAGRDPRFDADWADVLNVFTYFTIDSNLLVGAACVALAIDRGRGALWLHALCVAALLSILVTAIVFHAVLARLVDPTGAAALINHLLHTVVPLLFVAGWIVFGPRGVFHRRAVLLSLTFPLAWLAFTLARAAIEDYYPYPFLDAAELGWSGVAGNIAMIVALYVGLALAFGFMDRRAPG